MLKNIWPFFRARSRTIRTRNSQALDRRRTRLTVETMEERVTPSWGALPPSYVGTPSGATIVRLDQAGDATGSAAIATTEVDWFKLVAPTTAAYKISTDNTASGVDTVLGVYSGSGSRLAYSDDVSSTNTSSAVTINLTAGQSYFFGITNYTGTPGGAYGWSIDGPTLEDPFEDNDTLASAKDLGTLTTRHTLSGLALADAADWFKFTTAALSVTGNSVSISFSNSLGNLNLYLYDAAGAQLGQATSTSNAETISLAGRGAGTYYVRVAGYNGASNAAYSLTVNPPLADDGFENNDSRLTAFDLGTTAEVRNIGNLALADTADWYKFTTTTAGNAGSSVAIGFSNAAGNLTLRLHNSTGTFLRGSATSADSEFITLNGLSAGTYYVQVSGASAGVTNSNYSLTVSAPATGSWYATTLADGAVRGLVELLNGDGSLSRGDVMQVFTQVGQDGTVSVAEFNDLKAIVSDTAVIVMSDPVRVLSKKIVLGNAANARYQGSTLGNLAAGNSAAKLDKLVNKWFLGLDRPVADGAYVAAAGTLFSAGPTYEQLNQGEVGDCYFLVGLGAVALHNSGAIEPMFTDNGDGTFAVRFYRNGMADYVTVDRYLPASGGRFIYANMGDLVSNTGNVLWVALAEKAYAQLNEAGGLGQEVSANSYLSIEGGQPSDAIDHITGESAYFGWTSGLAFSTIQSRFDAGSYVTFGTRSSVAGNLVPGHAYLMVGYNASNQTVTLFNPWGADGGYWNGSLRLGYVTLTMSQLRTSFDAWWYS